MSVWIVDDDRSIRWVLEKALTQADIAWRSFQSAAEVRDALLTERPQVLLSDIRMPGESGLDLLKHVREIATETPVIVMTAFSDLDSAVASFQGGAFEYLAKPFDIDTAVGLVRNALLQSGERKKSEEPAALQGDLLGRSAPMQEVFRAIGRLAGSTVSVLITGESGTGKELVARALHRHSPRQGKPFVGLNTAAIPRELLESELFGHERGSFTGAAALRRGRFEQAQGGTLFLDEIGDMPLELQVRLLRVLQEGEFYRVGGNTAIKADVRILAATHQDLSERVAQGHFREDLLHRLDVVRIRLPALRDRPDDIPVLTRHFLARAALSRKLTAKRLTEAAMSVLANYAFPGNVRQLENFCQWITVMAPGERVDVDGLPPDVVPGTARAKSMTGDVSTPQSGKLDWLTALDSALKSALVNDDASPGDAFTQAFERQLIFTALTHTAGRRSRAATLLGWGRNTLTRKIEELRLDAELIERGL